ncbi:MAG: DUF3466 family protein [Planctomycetes bacterium]|nr:DUF3466 family protein [Planctomycetota bacterium]
MAGKTFLKTTRTIFAVLFLLAQVTFAAPPRYEIIDLGTLGGRFSGARAINDVGQVVGGSDMADGLFRHAFLWDPIKGMIDLSTIPGHNYSSAMAINDYGVVVGNSDPYGDQPYPFIWDSVNGMRYLDGLFGEGGALGVNDAGQVAGSVWWQAAYAFLWHSDSSVIDLGTLGGTHSSAWDINNTGKVVGNSDTAVGDNHAFLWDSTNGMRDLGTLGGNKSSAWAINDLGQVVGWSTTATGDWHAFLWDSNSGMIDLGAGWATGINNAGQVVGWLNPRTVGGPAFYWDSDNGIVILDFLSRAYDINNRGQIVGEYGGIAVLMTPIPPKIIYVDDDAAGANDGSSWADAYNYLQDALAAAYSGDEIHVAKGIYKPDQGTGATPGDREATFQLINGVTLKGGYAGYGEPDHNAHDIELYETILTGDLNGDDGDVDNPRDLLDEPTRSENSYHVVTGSGTDETAILDGFIITAGNLNRESLSPHNSGGGMYIDQGNLVISNCNFNNNSAWYAGGGIYIRVGSAVLTNCIFSGNSSGHGGGIRSFGSLTLTNCIFTGNWAAEGGGMENRGIMTLTNCIFSRNSAKYGAGGLENHTWKGSPMLINCMFNDNIGSWGGGMHNYYCSTAPTLINCSFINNLAGTGGGMCNLSSSPILVNCTFTYNSAFEGGGMSNLCGDEGPSEPVITKCAFIRNSAGDVGGGMFNQIGFQTLTNCILSGNSAEYGSGILVSESVLTLIGCTFSGNSADDSGTICSWYDNSELRLSNCILWDGGNEIYNRDDSTINVTYSDVQGGWPGEGNFEADPLFRDADGPDGIPGTEDDNLRLSIGSPCIDTGDPNYMAEPNETDLDDRPRVINGRIDMGAYEYSPPILAEARILPRTINLQSKGNWINCYIRLPEGYNVADIDPNSISLEEQIKPESLLLNEQQQVATAKFSREDVQPIFEIGDINLKITGRLTDGSCFEVTDTIKVIDKAGKK